MTRVYTTEQTTSVNAKDDHTTVQTSPPVSNQPRVQYIEIFIVEHGLVGTDAAVSAVRPMLSVLRNTPSRHRAHYVKT